MARRRQIYEGKAKILYEGPEPGTLIQYFKDDATAFNAQKRGTISGKGVDFWDLTNAESPQLLSSLLLEGIDYGDNTNAVWGVSWQGRYVWVGGTNTGLHVVDAADLANPKLVKRVPTSDFGGVTSWLGLSPTYIASGGWSPRSRNASA